MKDKQKNDITKRLERIASEALEVRPKKTGTTINVEIIGTEIAILRIYHRLSQNKEQVSKVRYAHTMKLWFLHYNF